MMEYKGIIRHRSKAFCQQLSRQSKRCLPLLVFFVAATTTNIGIAGADAPAIETKKITILYEENFGNRKGDAVRGRNIVTQACAQCHGIEGNAVSKEYPSLSAQLPSYLASQLVLFKMGKRRSPIMEPIAKSLALDDMLDVATYYSRQTPGKPYESSNAKLLAQGERLYREGDIQRGIPACTWCHGSSGNSSSPIFPRIGGQSPAYLESVLGVLKNKFFYAQEAYVMKAILVNMTQEDMKAVSEFTSTLKASENGY